jgi:hypothetical protein
MRFIYLQAEHILSKIVALVVSYSKYGHSERGYQIDGQMLRPTGLLLVRVGYHVTQTNEYAISLHLMNMVLPK